MKSRVGSLVVLAFILSLCETTALAQWQSIPQLAHSNVKCMLTVNDSTILIGGDNWTLLRSTDAGTTWTNVIGNGVGVDTITALGKGGGAVFAGSNGNASVYRSTDNGNSWIPENQGLRPTVSVYAFTYVNGTLYAATDDGVYGSTNLGGLWTAANSGLGVFQGGHLAVTNGITSVGSMLYAITLLQGGGVYETSTDSIHWVPIGLDTVWGYAIASIDTNVFAANLDGVFLYTGSGKTWLSRNNGLPKYINYCILAPMDTLLFAYVGGSSSGIYVTSDLGQVWQQINDSVFAKLSVRALVATKAFLIAGTVSGAWRIPLSSLKTGVVERTGDRPSTYVLSQNFPNPFNPTTLISYQIAVAGYVKLKVFDLLGREVKALINERQNAGSHTATFDASNLPSGVYFYRLESGTYSEAKKLILLK
jgi:photosystem II stability/assembly factor-like uncharacterized protein